VGDPSKLPANVGLPPGTDPKRLARQVDLAGKLDEDYARAGNAKVVEEHRAVYEAAKRLALSPRIKAFQIDQEPQAVRDRYGNTPFGQGCLLARRLVEAGVPFVEVGLGGWDTHKDNFAVTKHLVDWVDPAWAALLTDLKDRGLLDTTLVVWMGEFGRTPKINKDTGRDHHQKAFTLAMSGCGVKGGAVVGASTADGAAVKDRPVKVPDMFATFCHALGIDPATENETPVGRPVKIADGGKPVEELF
jgi:uncharacterized protein (DUF1501 family)